MNRNESENISLFTYSLDEKKYSTYEVHGMTGS